MSQHLSAALPLSFILLLSACGGGGADAPPAAAPVLTDVVVQGPITGFGSVIVNGIEFETTHSEFELDDSSGHSQDELAIGQIVTITGSRDDSGHYSADLVSYNAELEGPVSSVDAAAGRFVALGQTVQISASTALEHFAAIGDLAPGDFVEVSGTRDADGVILASFVERKGAEAEPDELELEIRGSIAQLDTDAQRFQLGEQAVSYAGAELDPPGLSLQNGLLVEVEGELVDGVLMASRVHAEDEGVEADEGTEVSIEGLVDSVSSSSAFVLNGVVVLHGAATEFEGGTAGDIAAGLRLEAEGAIDGEGRLLAEKIEFRTEDDDDGDDDDSGG